MLLYFDGFHLYFPKLFLTATEEIIKALQDVIKDFNNNLTEQFGDNFKQLNEAVLKMIEWQSTYKNESLLLKNYQFQIIFLLKI
jgi:translation initiation factor 2 alpha subunit (eIF-2alpha)